MNRILVTSVGGCGVGNQIVYSLSLNKNNYIVGTDIRPLNIYEQSLLNEFFVCPNVNSQSYFSFIDQIVTNKKIQAVFFGSLNEALFYYAHEDYFESKNIKVMIGSSDVFHICNNKGKLFDCLSQNNIPVLKYKVIQNENDINEIDFFPVIVKQNISAHSSINVLTANDREELELVVKLFLKKGINLIVQECIENFDKEYSVSVVSLEDESIYGCACLKRNFRSSVAVKESFQIGDKKIYISSGISEGIIDTKPEIVEQSKKIAKALGSTFSLNIQGVWENGTFWVIDAHSAITSSTYIKSLSGFNEAQFWVDYRLNNVKNKLDSKNNEYQKYICVRKIDNDKSNNKKIY